MYCCCKMRKTKTFDYICKTFGKRAAERGQRKFFRAKLKNIKRERIFQGCCRQKEYYAKKFKDLKEKLRLPKEYCLYAFRHSFATRMLNKTKDLHLVSQLLGHSDIKITAKHYINRSDDDIRKQLLEVKMKSKRDAYFLDRRLLDFLSRILSLSSPDCI